MSALGLLLMAALAVLLTGTDGAALTTGLATLAGTTLRGVVTFFAGVFTVAFIGVLVASGVVATLFFSVAVTISLPGLNDIYSLYLYAKDATQYISGTCISCGTDLRT